MKYASFVVPIAVAIALLVLYVQPGCKDVHDYEPPPDTTVPPPAPPELIAPINGYVFMFEHYPFEIPVIFEWTALEHAETYEWEYVIDTFPPITKIYTTNVCTLLLHDTTSRLCKHYWRVRAGSSLWEWCTEYSEQWHFELRWRPYGPQLLSPPDGAVLYIDSLPGVVELQWGTVQDEEWYEVMIFKDTVVYDAAVVEGNSYVTYADDTTNYSWQVRAGSSLWYYNSYWSAVWSFGVRLQK